jgi:hypothetical protein
MGVHRQSLYSGLAASRIETTYAPGLFLLIVRDP